MQIGDVAERTGLSLRTIRHYEEVGLLPESARSDGGFRLYEDAAVERLLVIRQMKPLDFTLEEMRELLGIVDALAHPGLASAERAEARARLTAYQDLVEERLVALRTRVVNAEAFVTQLHRLT